MDSIDKFGKIPSYSPNRGITSYSGINNTVNQLNKDNPNSFNNHMFGSQKETLSGEIIDLKSNEITVLLDDGQTIHAKIYDNSFLSIGQRISFHLQDDKGVTILEPVKTATTTADTIITKALEAANIPATVRNKAIALELLNNNMSLDSSSLNKIIGQANTNRAVSPQNLILMNKHNIPINNSTATEIDKYRNYEHRIIKEIDTISAEFPQLIDDVVNNKNTNDVLKFNDNLVRILAKPSADTVTANADKALSNINNIVKNNNEFTPISTENLTSINETGDLLSSSKIINKITSNVDSTITSSTDVNKIYGNINDDISQIIIENIGEVDKSLLSDSTSSKPITFNTFSETPSTTTSSTIDLSTLSPVGRNVENPTVASAFLKPSSADDLLRILEPYDIPEDIAKGIKDGTALLRDVAVVIEKALEMADEIDEYRVSDFYYSNQSSSAIKYGGLNGNGVTEMAFMDDKLGTSEVAQSVQNGTQNNISDLMNKTNTPDYVNLLLAKDAFEHPVIKNILNNYEVLQRDNSEVSTFLSHFSRGQLTSTLRDIPGSDVLADKIWTGNISANEILSEINSLLPTADSETVSKLLTSSEYKTVVTEAIINNWTISPNALRKNDAVSETYERMYHEINDLHNLVRSTIDTTSATADKVLKEFSGMKNNVDFMNTLNNMFSYVQLPLKMRDKTIHSDLYVLTNKQNLKKNKGNISVLLHLDMNYLGTLDVNITLSSNVVTSRFYVTDDFTKDLLSKNMEQLEYAMLEKGFILNSNVALKEKDINPINDFLEKDTPTTSIKRYTFDMRT
ncbi:MAG: flagellar hook-length control protein FliK [Lachnospiraceae bacterium]|nr:flagellar hook-length control protein FliK [Lachnospiraceae bacterium]